MPEKILYPCKRLRTLSAKEARYVKGVVQGKPRRIAAVDAGFNNPPKSEEVRRAIIRVMDNAGLSDHRLVRELKKYVFKAEDEDNSLKALRMAFELKDHFPANRREAGLTLSQINIYQGVDDNALKARVRRLIKGNGEEKSEERPLLSDEGNSGIQRPDK
jgi:hypothetical protein